MKRLITFTNITKFSTEHLIKKHIILFVCFFISSSILSAQVKRTVVRGKVTDQNNKPIVNVNIQKKNTSIGTSTNQQGNFSTSLFHLGDTLIISHLSYIKKEVVLNQFDIKISLQAAQNILAETKIYAKKKNIKLVNNPWVIDYCVVNDSSVLSLQVSNQGNVLKLIQSGKIVFNKSLCNTYDELIVDCTNDIYLTSEKTSKNVLIDSKTILLGDSISSQSIQEDLQDCLLKIAYKQYLKRYTNSNKNASVFCYNWATKQTKIIYNSFDTDYFKFLLDLNRDAKNSVGNSADDKTMFLLHLAKHQSKINLFKVNNHLIIIDDIKKKIIFFDKKDIIENEVSFSMSFNKNKKIKYIEQDKVTEDIYYFIKEDDQMNIYQLDIYTGQFHLINNIKPFIEKPTVYNGRLYYLDYNFRKETRELYKLPL